MSNKMKVLIVGAPSSLGAAITSKLTEAGFTCDAVDRMEDIVKKELNADWERGMVSEIQKCSEPYVQQDKLEKQRSFIERIDNWLSFAGDPNAYEFHEMAIELKELMLESLADPDLNPEMIWDKLPKEVALVANVVKKPRELAFILDMDLPRVLVKVSPEAAARLVALNGNMVRCIKWFQKGVDDTGYVQTSLSQPDLSNSIYYLGDNVIDVHGLDRLQVILTGDEYQVVTDQVHPSFAKYGSANFIIEGDNGDKYGLHTYEEMVKLVFGNEHLNHLYAPMVIGGDYVHRKITVIRHKDGFIELQGGCADHATRLATVALSIKPRGTY